MGDVIHIITPSCRHHCLPSVAASIAYTELHGLRVVWHVSIQDEYDLYGGSQVNDILDTIHNGWIWLCNDDNVLHPGFFKAVSEAIRRPGKVKIFSEKRLDKFKYLRSMKENVKDSKIDGGQMVVHSDIFKNYRFDMEKYRAHADGKMLEQMLIDHPDEFEFIDSPVVYFNALLWPKVEVQTKPEQERIDANSVIKYYYNHIHYIRKNNPTWRGTRLDKYPQDMALYADVIFKRKPEYIIETGTFHGGSALFFGDMMSLTGGKKVFSIDINHDRKFPEHPLVEYIKGSSADPVLVKSIADRISDPIMVVLDSDHSTDHVRKEMELFAPLVTKGQYMVVEDCYSKSTKPIGPYYAVQDFLKTHSEFKLYNLEKRFIFGMTNGGWLRKIR